MHRHTSLCLLCQKPSTRPSGTTTWTLSRFKLRESEYDREIAEEVENDMKERVELMYSYDDIVHDRHILRNRFLHEMNKKTTLRDIGAKLDEFVLDSKANMG